MSVTTDRDATEEFNLDTLEPYGVTDQRVRHPDLNGSLPPSNSQFDPETRDLYNYNLESVGT
ncbi:MAG: hypothetical protein M1831_002651 [Alyxoria varia]|nr:MAG: hypothetical protein M1831_002651 [Alyxoria varia]